jgi:hypothetical protein
MTFNDQNPLWLPPGSVRAVLVLGLTFTVVAILLKFAAYHEDIPPGMEKFMTGAITAIVLLIKDYITQRGNEMSARLKEEGKNAAPPAP